VLVSGGSVHPAGTPLNEALMLREYLLDHGASEEQILVEPHARHTTTNLRNAGRMLRSLGLHSALVVTGFESETFLPTCRSADLSICRSVNLPSETLQSVDREAPDLIGNLDLSDAAP
jgi:hypothetical protein